MPAYHVVTATNGQEALDYLLAHVDGDLPDLILLDIHMPVMDGREFLRRIKAVEALRHIPVVAITASTADVDIQQAHEMLDLGAASYVVKPSDFNELKTLLHLIGRYWSTVAIRGEAG